MKKFFKEFIDFIQQGNLVEIAIGLLLATAFKDLVTSFSNSFIMPVVNKCLGFAKEDTSYFTILDMKFEYGNFISSLISFLIIGFVLFMIVKSYNALIHKKDEETNVETELSLLKEIRDLLDEKK
ncbi:large conductance mechanosensitive channel [Bacilli bacterium PM5-3]|nr:large conductance mechanosensitive channel [Bacilli bacterium PM5-3]MDH6603257.1 large conductance mechanosensitive channel [Bacilli bacterium PM5-9]